ncbi:hypothetical protein JCM8547_001418 [Rhodosporidiobolus lusitaniae]
MDSPLPLESRSLLVLHASVTGNAIDIAERIGRRGRREGWHVVVKGVKQFNQVELLEHALVVFVLPTTGNGAPPPSFVPLWTALLHPGLPSDFLEDLRYAVFGLGDSSYGKYNWVGKKMSRRLDALGAHAVVERGEADDQNELGIESTFPEWLNSLMTAIDPLFPAPANFTKVPPIAMLPARIRLAKVASSTSNGTSPTADAQAVPWSDDCRWARLVETKRVTAEDWYQDVRAIELEVEDAEENERQRLYTAGDVLEIRPQNRKEEVDRFLASAGWEDKADDVYTITASNSDQPLPPHLPSPFRTTLRYLLTYELDISCVPTLSFFEWLAGFSEGDMQEKLRWFCEPAGQDDLIEYTHRPRRTINEVMYEFRSAKVPPEYIFDLLPPIRPRGFSISSSPASHNGKVDLLVAIVKYKSTLSVPRQGLTTSYLASLQPGSRLSIRFDTSGLLRLPPGTPPLIMIGPGTGVAPFRALTEERQRAGAKENLLLFGCRKESKDFYFQEEWAKMVDNGELTLSVAASRDQEDKVYVQHRIPEYGERIWDYFQRGGFLYVCGSSINMPKAVKKAILQIFADHGGLWVNSDGTGGAAERKWDELERQGRIVEETWG